MKNLLTLNLLILMMISPSAWAEPNVVPETDGSEALKAAQKRLAEAEDIFKRSGSKHYASPSTWTDEVIYQIMVDRFNDGDPSNNHANIEDHQRDFEGSTQNGLQDYHHGGDLKGITQRLDYLKDLGVTSLWITPILKSTGSYHGYCTSDYTEIDPNFGTHEDFRELVRQAHARGLKIVLDIVVNHLCDKNSHYDERIPFDQGFYGLCLDDLNNKMWTGGPTNPRGQRTLLFASSFFGPMRNSFYFSRCGYRQGDATSTGAPAIFGDFSPQMLDFNTMNYDFQKIFTVFHQAWIAEADIDGFRLDAAKHVTPDFIARFSTDIRDYAQKLGKSNFYIIGEVADNSSIQANYLGKMKTETPEEWNNIPQVTKNILPEIRPTYSQHAAFPYPGVNGIFDFTHSGALREAFLGHDSLMKIKNYFWNGGESDNSTCGREFCPLTYNGDTSQNWNLLEIHDWPRFLVANRDEFRFRTALGYLFTTSGVPIVYYGAEQGLDGRCQFNNTTVKDSQSLQQLHSVCDSEDFGNHPRFRQDMFMSGAWRLGSIVPEIDRLSGIGVGSGQAPSGADPYLNTSHDLYKYVRKLIAVRKSCSALRQGGIYFRAVHDRPDGLMVFSRIKDGREIVVVVNSSFDDIPLEEIIVDANLQGGHTGRRFRNLFNEAEQGEVYVNSSGTALLSFKRANSGNAFVAKSRKVAIFVAGDDIRGFDSNLEVSLCRE